MKDFIASLSGKGVEAEIPRTVFIVLGSCLAIVLAASALIPGLISRHGYGIILCAFTLAIIIPAARQVRAYKTLPCMSGMMVGMTLGMLAGFLIGFYVGASNGMFYGSVVGMAFGILIGTSAGSCCGIMGFMEGIMAGFMGGLMGAMTAIMLLNDNLKAAGILLFIIGAVIAISLSIMVFREMKGMKRARRDGDVAIAAFSALLMIATILIIAFGPRSALFQ